MEKKLKYTKQKKKLKATQNKKYSVQNNKIMSEQCFKVTV